MKRQGRKTELEREGMVGKETGPDADAGFWRRNGEVVNRRLLRSRRRSTRARHRRLRQAVRVCELASGWAWRWAGCSCSITLWRPRACSRKTRRSTRSSTCRRRNLLAERDVSPLSPQPAAREAGGGAAGRLVGSRHRAGSTSRSWKRSEPDQATFAHLFARSSMRRVTSSSSSSHGLSCRCSPLIGGLAVFAWSRRLYGNWGGLLSLALWVFCPNMLAHSRLITSDMGSTALGVAATYVFWRYLQQPSWRRAARGGVMLGLAQLTKFTMLLLYAIWPFLWLVRLLVVCSQARVARTSGPRASPRAS